MSANGNITNYFKPKSQNPQTQRTPASPAERLPRDSRIGSSSDTPLTSSPAEIRSQSSTPLTPGKPAPRNVVIEDSDDGGNDSDDSLPDLLSRPAAKPAPAPSRPLADITTPRAKRTALEFHSSPLTLQPRQQRHRFDINALLSHVQRDEAANASATRVAAMLEEETSREQTVKARSELAGQSSREQTSAELLDDIMEAMPDMDGEDGERLLRAVKRTEGFARRKQWYFFGDSLSMRKTKNEPFPTKVATGVWKFLSNPETRRSDLQRGMVSAVMQRGHILPDEIFSWVLDEICIERNSGLSDAYHSLIRGGKDANQLEGHPSEQLRHLLDEARLHRWFQQAGATDQALLVSEKVYDVGEHDIPYSDQADWHSLRMMLTALANVGRWMSLRPVIYTVSMLLRMSLDPVLHRNVDIFRLYTDAVGSLLDAIEPRDWDIFCEEVATALYKSISTATFWWDAITSLPSGEMRLQDFRRRLAMVFFFDDVQHARQHAEDTFSIRAVIDRLEDRDFIIDRQTDYFELSAYIYLLNIVVDDGSPAEFESQTAEEQFNLDIDELTTVIKTLELKIPHTPGSYSSRLEAKAILGAVRSRLAYSVRTRPPRKQDIYDKAKRAAEKVRPQQQEFMHKFLQQGKCMDSQTLPVFEDV